MKTSYNIFYAILGLVALFSCTAEDDMDILNTGKVDRDGQTEVVFNLGIPAHDLPTTTRAITDDSKIEDFSIWVFKGAGDNATFEKEIKEGDKDANGNPILVFKNAQGGLQQLYVLLPESDETITLSMIANATATTPAVGTPKTVALNTLEYALEAARMPMYGEQTLTSVKQGTHSSIHLRRAMAKIEVDAREAFSLFKLESIELLNINLKGKVAGGILTDQQNYPVQVINADSKEKNIFTFYLPEIQDINAQERGKKVSILIKGKYRDDHSSFYRLELIGRENKIIKDIVRNHKYVFLIENIGASGYTTRDDALKGPASNAGSQGMELQVIENEDIMDITTDGSYYLGVTSAQITAGYNENYYFANFSVQGSNPDGWKMITADFQEGVRVSMDSFKAGAGESVNVVNSVWVYIEKGKVVPNDQIDIYIYSGNIRKKIVVTIPTVL